MLEKKLYYLSILSIENIIKLLSYAEETKVCVV